MYSAQQLLDQLNEINLPNIFNTPMSDKDRAAHLKVAKQKVKRIKQLLRQEQKLVKDRWDGRDPYQAEREKTELLAYSLIDDAISKIEISVTELETAIKTKSPLPTFQEIGSVISESQEGYTYTVRLMTEDQFNRQQEEHQRRMAALEERQRIDEQERLTVIRANLVQVQHLIQQRKYRKARELLEGIDHPKAREWLDKLDLMTAKRSNRLRNYAIAIVLSMMFVCGGMCALTGNIGRSSVLPTVAVTSTSSERIVYRPTSAETRKTETSTLASTKRGDTAATKKTIAPAPSSTNAPTNNPTRTPSKIPTASAKAEAERVRLLKRAFRGIEHLTGTGEVRAFPSDNKQDFTVIIYAFLDIYGETEPTANALKTRTINTLGFTPNIFKIWVFNGFWIETYEWMGSRWSVDRVYDDGKERILITTATALAPTATRYILPTDIPIEYYPTIDYSYSNPSSPSDPGNGATALCNDGTYSFSSNRRGTCSHHGGVAVWYK